MAQKSTTTFAVLGHPLSDFPGATVSGSLPLRENLLNDLLQSKLRPGGPVKQGQITILDRNCLSLSALVDLPIIKNVNVELEIERGIDFQLSPLLKMRLLKVPWWFGVARMAAGMLDKLPNFVKLDGQNATVDLKMLIQKLGYAEILPYIKTVEIVTQKGLLTLAFLVRVDE